MRRIIIAVLALFLACAGSVEAQQKPRGLLYSVDRIMSGGRIGRAGRNGSATQARPISLPERGTYTEYGCQNIGADLPFVNHLFDNRLYNDIETLFSSARYSRSDTLFYLQGRWAYETRHLYDAGRYFMEVGSSSVFYDPARLYAVAIEAWNGNISKASSLLDTYCGNHTDIAALQRCGLALMKKDFSTFDSEYGTIDSRHIAIRNAALELKKAEMGLQDFRPRSPFLCAAASAAVPGLGKMLCDRTGEGVAALLTVGSLAAVTAENWCKYGPRDWKTILFGSITALAYTANIYGSYVSASLYNQETVNGYETAVLVNILVPLHSIFR